MRRLLLGIALSMCGVPALAEEMPAAAGRSAFAVPGGYLIVLAVLALFAALVVVGCMRAQLRTAERQQSAARYIREGSFELDVRQDCYLYKRVERRKIEQKQEKTEE
jgi:hypothetical protein